jgi:hypothetical protein
VTAPSAITVPANARPTTTEAGPAPDKVVLRDDGGSVTLTWEDPGAGKVPFIVSGARDGNALFAMASVPPGQTTSTIYGLNVNYNYCFTVSRSGPLTTSSPAFGHVHIDWPRPARHSSRATE